MFTRAARKKAEKRKPIHDFTRAARKKAEKRKTAEKRKPIHELFENFIGTSQKIISLAFM